MNIDMSQFDNLELENIGQWPPLAKAVLAVFTFIVLVVAGFFFVIDEQINTFNTQVAEEQTLKQQYQSKYHIAANLEKFQAQMEEAEAMFANQIKRLPESHETPGLLDDITYVGTTSGLKFVKLNWQPEITREIYIELPIDIEVVGSYHQFGEFVSKIAGLPRIVTLHDFTIDGKAAGDGQLKLKLQAKTYRYRETN